MKIRQTCIACPTQWEGTLNDGRFVYFRYRSGWLTVSVADTQTGAYASEAIVHSADLSEERGSMDGYMEDQEVIDTLQRVLDEQVTEATPEPDECPCGCER